LEEDGSMDWMEHVYCTCMCLLGFSGLIRPAADDDARKP
jgi:hypothetical protein